MPEEARELAESILRSDNLEKLYQQYRSEEKSNKESLIQFEKDYPNVVTEDNLKDIIRELKARKKDDRER